MTNPTADGAVAIPVIRLTGSAFERGQQYGAGARERILRSQRAYAEVFAHFARWDWRRVRDEAARFVQPISDFGAPYLEEMRGIAVGSGLDFLDVLALNLRTEILFAARARQAGATLPPVAECTSFADVEDDDTRLLGQNWDWMPFAKDTVVLLEAVPDAGPAWMSVVEAGLLAKFGMNSAGLALTTNALVSSADLGEPGVPYHVMLRALLDCDSSDAVIATLERAERSSSANYMIAIGDAWAMNAETRPGGPDRIIWTTHSGAGTLLHANHFSETTPLPDGLTDVGLTVMPDSLHRLNRAAALSEAVSTPDVDCWKRLLADHDGYPDSLCCHPDPMVDPMDQGLTVASVVFEPAKLRAHLAIGTPCRAHWQVRDYKKVFALDLQ